MAARTRKHVSHRLPRRHIIERAKSPIVLILFAFATGFCTHLLMTVIFAENKGDGVIHACVSKNGDLRVITEYKEYKEGKREQQRKQSNEDKNGCRQNETALDWNIQGPPGPAGSSSASEGNSFLFICPECDISGNRIGDRLKGSNLSNAVLPQVNAEGVNFSGVNFSNANLEQITLNNANLSGVNFTGANIKDALLENANLDGVTWSNTICPDGSNSNDHDNTCAGHLGT